MEEDVRIEIDIAGRKYKVNIKDHDKGIFDKASEIVNETLKKYASMYSYKDNQDLLAMVLLQYMTSYIKIQQNNNTESRDKRIENRLTELDKYLTEILNK
ncbi:MAG: cell division protein ZapA [Bacteroidales bacterium]|jgi:cell division protein ZapA (FtsZ GTPase activity inhibitor)|nr:cell division protein ZapA [Bacteroidales bacterium]